MPNRFRRMPIPPEMNAFQRQICSDQRFLARQQTKHGAVISNSGQDSGVGFAWTWMESSQSPDSRNQRFFSDGHRALNIRWTRHFGARICGELRGRPRPRNPRPLPPPFPLLASPHLVWARATRPRNPRPLLFTIPTLALTSSRVGAGDLARAIAAMLACSKMQRKYDYRRTLPHLQKDNRAIFITFNTWQRWILPDIARDLALESCLHANGRKCALHVVVVMPDHMHIICTLLEDEQGPVSIPELTQAVKGESAHRINRALERRGRVWQDESFDHVLRCEESVAEKVAYVLQNPVRAGFASEPRGYRWVWVDPAFDSK
jgi:putative transposase